MPARCCHFFPILLSSLHTIETILSRHPIPFHLILQITFFRESQEKKRNHYLHLDKRLMNVSRV